MAELAYRVCAALVIATIAMTVVAVGSIERSYGGTIVAKVNTTADHADDGCQNLAIGDCTLREAMNDMGGEGDRVEFEIPDTDPGCAGSGVCTITPSTSLPAISANGILIDGFTQTGASPNTNGTNAGLNASLKVRIIGPIAGSGIVINADDVTVRGLVIGYFQNAGIAVTGTGNHVSGNYLGTNAAGTSMNGNGAYGVYVSNSENLIGGPSPAERNLISGNEYGVYVVGSAIIQGNLIGTNAAGNGAIPNQVGVLVEAFASGTIGGATSAARNVISGNGTDGVYASDHDEIIVQNNFIGTAADGQSPIGNLANGVSVRDGSAVISENTIAYNGTDADDSGVLYRFDSPATINANSIHSNTGLGIDLEGDGVTANDPGDVDNTSDGANSLQNYPELTQAQVTNSVSIKGTFDSTPSTTFRFEFFSNDECDPSGNGEGRTFLGAGNIPTDGDGVISFTANSPADVSPGDYITATATNLTTSETSEFSNCTEVEPAATPSPTPTGSFSPTPTDVPLSTPTPTPTGQPPTPTPSPTPTPTPTPPGETQTPTPTPTPTDAAPQFTQGDNDCDGDSDAVDALQILLALAGLQPNQQANCPELGAAVPAGADETIFGDIDCDGDLDAVDALQILRNVAGLVVNQEPGCRPVGV